MLFSNDILKGAKKICELNNIHSNYIVKIMIFQNQI